LTILRGYVVAGRPHVQMLPMGSYDDWSRVVRAALVWAGVSDPAETQSGLQESADLERDAVAGLLRTWHGLLGSEPVTVADFLRRAEGLSSPTLRDAIVAMADSPGAGLPTSRRLGARLRNVRGRIVEGFVLERVREHTEQGATWRVRLTV
jgi:putative DNA primase/helicase